MRVRALSLALVVALAAAACGGEGDDRAAAPSTTPSASPTAVAPGQYDTLQELADAFDCKDLQDVGTGGNAGLVAFGICRIGRHNIDIYLTSQRGLWEHLANQFSSVLGPNFVIVCPTGPKAARIVHERLGGDLRIP